MNFDIENVADEATVARVVQQWVNQYEPEVRLEVLERLATMPIPTVGSLVLRLKYCTEHASMWDHEDVCETEVVRWYETPYRDGGEECRFVWVEGRVANA